MPTALRDIYLSVIFLLGAGATFAPYLGIDLPKFTYQSVSGKTVSMPVSVVVYAVFLIVAVAVLARRLLDRRNAGEVADVR